MQDDSLAGLVAAANEPMRKAAQTRQVGSGAGRFELYHAAPSLCSHKVRTVLAEKDIPYLSHDMRIVAGNRSSPDNYHPGYVRLRLQGAPNARLVNGYTGQSSVTSEGFDPCVVPTLVDHDKNRVVVDSAQICEYLDREAGTPHQLIPEEIAAEVHAQIERVDQAPHVALLYGAHPDQDVRPKGLALNIKGVHAKKVRSLEEMMALVPDEQGLIDAYRSKIAKETSAGEFVCDAGRMRQAHEAMSAHVDALNQQLQTHDGQWVLGDVFTLADIVWTVSLYRLKWLGLGIHWQAMPRLNQYLDRAFARRSFQQGVIRWLGAYSPSPHVKEFSGPAAFLKFLWAAR